MPYAEAIDGVYEERASTVRRKENKAGCLKETQALFYCKVTSCDSNGHQNPQQLLCRTSSIVTYLKGIFTRKSAGDLLGGLLVKAPL
ncbi:hypothetical protein ACJ8BD_30565, partial [Klebsiella pneumoniae]